MFYLLKPRVNSDQFLVKCIAVYRAIKRRTCLYLYRYITKMFSYTLVITSGRSEVGGRRPRDRAERTEVRIFSPTLDKSMPPPPPPWKKINEVNSKALVPSKPPSPLKTPVDENGLSASGGGQFDCISIRCTQIKPRAEHHCRRRVCLSVCLSIGRWRRWRSDRLRVWALEREREGEIRGVVGCKFWWCILCSYSKVLDERHLFCGIFVDHFNCFVDFLVPVDCLFLIMPNDVISNKIMRMEIQSEIAFVWFPSFWKIFLM